MGAMSMYAPIVPLSTALSIAWTLSCASGTGTDSPLNLRL